MDSNTNKSSLMDQTPKQARKWFRFVVLLCLMAISAMNARHYRHLTIGVTPASTPASTRKKNNSQNNNRRAAICWTGVSEDWPSFGQSSVVSNVLRPLLHAGFELDIFLAVQKTSPDRFPAFREPYSFFPPHNKTNYSKTTARELVLQEQVENLFFLREFPTNYSQDALPAFAYRLQQWLLQGQQHNANQSTAHSVHLHEYEPLQNPPVPPEYFKAIIQHDALVLQDDGNRTITMQAQTRTLWRVVNHLRTLHAQALCGELLSQAAQPGDWLFQIGGGGGQDAAMAPIPIQQLEATLQPKQLGILPQGQHDQIQVIVQDDNDQHVAKEVFTKPYQAIYDAGIFGTQLMQVQTLPDFLQLVYQSLNVTMLAYLDGTNRTEIMRPKPMPTTWVHGDSNSNPVAYPLSDAKYLNQSFLPPAPRIETMDNGKNTSKSALICVTGQLQRLELENKIEMLLQPMHEQGGYDTIDLVIVTNPGKALFQKQKRYAKGTEPSAFATVQEMQNFLQNSNKTSFLHNITVKSYHPDPGLPINPQYLMMRIEHYFGRGGAARKGESMRDDNFLATFETVAMANMKMIETYRHCYAEQDKAYDLYVRLREDAGFRDGKVSPALYDETVLKPGSYLTHEDKNNGGINDRMAFVAGRDSALCYFHLPYVMLYNGKRMDDHSKSTEHYFKRLYNMLSNGCISKHIITKDPTINPQKLYRGKWIR